jgi:hypothetical protein
MLTLEVPSNENFDFDKILCIWLRMTFLGMLSRLHCEDIGYWVGIFLRTFDIFMSLSWVRLIQSLILLKQADWRIYLPIRELAKNIYKLTHRTALILQLSRGNTILSQNWVGSEVPYATQFCGLSLLSHLWHFACVWMGESVLVSVISYLKNIDESRRLQNIQSNHVS